LRCFEAWLDAVDAADLVPDAMRDQILGIKPDPAVLKAKAEPSSAWLQRGSF
jgi:hypothetical protein